MHLAVALDGAGWHPAAWREPEARPAELLSGRYWADLVGEAERGLLDLVTFEDGFGLQADGPRGRLDSVLVAARVAPLTSHIGLVPTVVTSLTEPFHAAKAIASLDYAATGRAGVLVRPSADPAEAALIGRRAVPPAADLRAEAADYVEVMRRLWDSWEDDAEIRDVATGRFVDRDKLHYIDFTGRFFSVKGPSITPRPPQGQPVVAALGPGLDADLTFGAGLAFGDLTVLLADTTAAAVARQERLDSRAPFRAGTEVFVGTPAELADLLLARPGPGFRLRPATLPYDLTQITRGLVPELQRRNAFRIGYEAGTLRGLLGLPRPANRYAGAS